MRQRVEVWQVHGQVKIVSLGWGHPGRSQGPHCRMWPNRSGCDTIMFLAALAKAALDWRLLTGGAVRVPASR